LTILNDRSGQISQTERIDKVLFSASLALEN
jgi:hypothetical protein